MRLCVRAALPLFALISFQCSNGEVVPPGPTPPTGQQPKGNGPPPPGGGTKVTPPLFSITRHTFLEDDREQVLRDLDLVAQVGAKMVRTDFWWFSVEPQIDSVDANALDHFEWFVKAAASKGIGVIGVLSNPPGWA